MSNKYKYPTTYELKEILSRIANKTFLNRFAQSRGVFVTNVNQELLANVLSKLFYDDSDLEIIRQEAYRENNSHTLTGFVVKSKKKNFNLKTIYERLRETGKGGIGVILNEVTKVNDDESYDYKSSFEYIKTKPGRIEFLQNETNFFNFYFKDLKNGAWQIEVDSSKSTDTKEIKNLFTKNLPMDEYGLELIDQDYLTSDATIVFFDRLAKEGLSSEWNFLDVKHLTVKRGNDIKDNEDDLDELDAEEDLDSKQLSKEELTGITQAILEGKNLREDPFVRDCEGKGYKFSAMTYEFDNQNTPYVISIKAEFKGRPKVFEVGIAEVFEKTGIKGIKHPTSLSSKENRTVRSIFWNNAKVIYESIRSQTKCQ